MIRNRKKSSRTKQNIDVSKKVIYHLNFYDECNSFENRIRTTKYRWFSFVPIFLYLQYCKISNIFYLIEACFTLIPNIAIVNPVTSWLPVLFVLLVAFMREIVEDCQRWKADKYTNNKKFDVIRQGLQSTIKSKNIQQGDLIMLTDGQEVPADCLLLLSTHQSCLAFVNTANLDGEQGLKPKNAIFAQNSNKKQSIEDFNCFHATVETDEPNDNMQIFNGTVCVMENRSKKPPSDDMYQNATNNQIHEKHYFNISYILLKGVKIQATGSVVAAVVFTGSQTRLMKNMVKTQYKTSQLETRLNRIFMYFTVMVFLFIFLIMAVGGVVALKYTDLTPSMQLEKNTAIIFLIRFTQSFSLSSYLVPISLFVTIELTRFFQSMFVNADKQLRRHDVLQWQNANPKKKIKQSPFADQANSQLACSVKNGLSIENLAEVDIIFSDKTGTLTKNEMKFKQFLDENGFMREKLCGSSLFTIGLCHTVYPKHDSQQILYEGESPDEVAFVQAAEKNGLRFLNRTQFQCQYDFNGTKLSYKIFAIIPFSSSRKRMSIILQELQVDGKYHTPENIVGPGQPFVICKGADNSVLPLVSDLDDSQKQAIQYSIDQFSCQGLRTLVYGIKRLDIEFCGSWARKWNQIIQLGEDDIYYQQHTKIIENDLNYFVVSGVEDSLQDNLHETLTSLSEAGIKIWMLTGDKTLTAVNIAKTAGLSAPNCQYINLTEQHVSKSQLQDAMKTFIQEQRSQLSANQVVFYDKLLEEARSGKKKCCVSSSNLVNPPNLVQFATNHTIIVDSYVLNLIISKNLQYLFFHLSFFSHSVVCCRLSPKEKALIVQMCHYYQPKLLTLGIGDGFNDSIFLQAAQIGIGVAGKEGLHACNVSDISIPEFQFLKRLILVHGRLTHFRNAEVCDYCIYKNIVVTVANYLYQIFNMFTIQIATEQFLLMMYNTIITTIPILIFALNDYDIQPSDLMKNPSFLKNFKRKYWPNFKSLGINALVGLYQGIIIFFSCYGIFVAGSFGVETKMSDMYTFQTMIIMVIIFVTIARCLINSFVWNRVNSSALFVTIIIIVVCILICEYTVWMSYGIGQMAHIYSTYSYMFYIVSICVICLAPEFIYKQIHRLWFPSLQEVTFGNGILNTCHKLSNSDDVITIQDNQLLLNQTTLPNIKYV